MAELAGVPALRQGRIELLGMTRALASPAGMADPSGDQSDPADPDWAEAHWTGADWEHADWEQAGAPALWRFHLHYWDWAWRLATEPDRADARAWFAAMWQSWHAQVAAGRGDAWLPYPAALRAWSYCGLHRDLVAGSDIEASFIADLSAHAGFLRRNVESDVGGNHLIKNLKALAGLAVFFGDARRLGQALDQLASQLAVQVLPDGGHYERAPAYHCQVLADLVDVAGAAPVHGPGARPGTARRDRPDAPLAALRAGPGRARSRCSTTDTRSTRSSSPPCGPGCHRPSRCWSCRTPASSGRPRDGWRLLADVGAPCPR